MIRLDDHLLCQPHFEHCLQMFVIHCELVYYDSLLNHGVFFFFGHFLAETVAPYSLLYPDVLILIGLFQHLPYGLDVNLCLSIDDFFKVIFKIIRHSHLPFYSITMILHKIYPHDICLCIFFKIISIIFQLCIH